MFHSFISIPVFFLYVNSRYLFHQPYWGNVVAVFSGGRAAQFCRLRWRHRPLLQSVHATVRDDFTEDPLPRPKVFPSVMWPRMRWKPNTWTRWRSPIPLGHITPFDPICFVFFSSLLHRVHSPLLHSFTSQRPVVTRFLRWIYSNVSAEGCGGLPGNRAPGWSPSFIWSWKSTTLCAEIWTGLHVEAIVPRTSLQPTNDFIAQRSKAQKSHILCSTVCWHY